MELQTKLPVKYKLGTHFVPKVERSFFPERKYDPDDCVYADIIYDANGYILYVLYKKNDPAFEATIEENALSDMYVPLTDDMLL